MYDLLHVKQEGSVEDYVAVFYDLRYSAAMHNPTLDEIFFVQQFVKGLKPEIQGSVLCQVPTTVNRAVLLAQLHQDVLEMSKFKPQKQPYPLRQGKPDAKNGAGGLDFSKERQLRDYRRLHGLCFTCGEKYEVGHAAKCTKRNQAQLQVLTAEDMSLELSDEVLRHLGTEDQVVEGLCNLSVHAVSGTEGVESIRLRAFVKNQVSMLLVDSGSSATFINYSFVQQVGMTTISCSPVKVKVANGAELVSQLVVPAVEWWCDGHTFHTDMMVLDLGSYDAILGFDWLKSHSPMTCGWDQKTFQFWHKNEVVTLQGVVAAEPSPVIELSAIQFRKWFKGNEVWALAVVDFCAEESAIPPISDQPEALTAVLAEFSDVFADPKTLPPARVFDHVIPLVPGAVPVNSKPYKYSPFHKSEIERQVEELLAAGLIEPSASPFASPVLLVKKKDGT
jgi:hypothetical protein